MASLWKHPESKYYFACFTLPDGRRTKRSTKTTDRKTAERLAMRFEEAAGKVATESQARRVISDIYEMVSGNSLAASSIADYLTQWAESKQNEVAATTMAAYSLVVKRFIEFLGNKAQLELSRLEPKDIAKHRDGLAKERSHSSANKELKIIRVALAQAKRDGFIESNPAERVSVLKNAQKDVERRPFTLDEIQRILEVADQEWKGMILFGLYTGQRLGDIARLTWQNIDLKREQVSLTTGKTGRRQIIPLAKTLLTYIESLPATDNPKQILFPSAYHVVVEQGRTGTLSNRFYDILVSAGLAQARSHKAQGKGGRSVKRQANEISFHALRHTATSLLKNAGVSDVVARELVGHDSKDVSQQYTHIETKTLKTAVDLLPEVNW